MSTDNTSNRSVTGPPTNEGDERLVAGTLPVSRAEATARQEEQFGGMTFGSAFFGLAV